MSGRRRAALLLMALIFIMAGVLHFAVPDPYARIIPPWLPAPMLLVYISGAAEIAGGAGLLIERTRRAAGAGLILLLLAVWPANIQMWIAARDADAGMTEELLLLLRIPLQVALIWCVWRIAVVKPKRPNRNMSRD